MMLRDDESQLRAIIFDLDGVLWDSNPFHFQAFVETCIEAGVRPPDSYATIAGLDSPSAFKQILESNHNPCVLVESLVHRKRQIFSTMIDEIPDQVDFLKSLRLLHSQLKFGLVTGGSSKSVSHFLKRVGSNFFDAVINADSGVLSKPSPQPYLEAAKRMSLEPRKCLVVEDSRAGLISAISAGMIAVHLNRVEPTGQDCIDLPVHICINSLSEIPILLGKP
jgi:beta-phosphoglucomutase